MYKLQSFASLGKNTSIIPISVPTLPLSIKESGFTFNLFPTIKGRTISRNAGYNNTVLIIDPYHFGVVW